MKVLLLQDVPKLGKKHDVKNVSDGYALNFLFPRKLANIATEGAVKKVEADRAMSLEGKKKHEDAIIASIKAIKGGTITIQTKTNDNGHLFSAVHKKEIAEALTAAGVDAAALGADAIKLEKPFKEVGEYSVEIAVGETKHKVKVVIK